MNKKEFQYLLLKNGLTINKFAELTGLAVGTCYGWDDKKKPFPTWLSSWFENYENKNQNFKKDDELKNMSEKIDKILNKLERLEIMFKKR